MENEYFKTKKGHNSFILLTLFILGYYCNVDESRLRRFDITTKGIALKITCQAWIEKKSENSESKENTLSSVDIVSAKK